MHKVDAIALWGLEATAVGALSGVPLTAETIVLCGN